MMLFSTDGVSEPWVFRLALVQEIITTTLLSSKKSFAFWLVLPATLIFSKEWAISSTSLSLEGPYLVGKVNKTTIL